METFYVSGHRSPDSDSICAAIALADLLNRKGYQAKAVLASRLNNEMKFILNYLQIEKPELLSDAAGKRFILVDHSSYLQAIANMDQAEVIAIYDHHEPGDIRALKINRFENVGSTCTLIHKVFEEESINISTKIAGLLLCGLLSDTRKLTSNVTPADHYAFEKLLILSGIEDTNKLYEQMQEAAFSYDGMSEREILLSDYKEYKSNGQRYGFAIVSSYSDKQQKHLAYRLKEAAENYMAETGLEILFIKFIDRQNKDMIITAYGEKAFAIMDDLFHNFNGQYFVFDRNLSRKKKLVPLIDEYLKNA